MCVIYQFDHMSLQSLARPSFRQSIRPSVRPPVRPPVHPTVYTISPYTPSVRPSTSIRPSGHPSVRSSVRPFIQLSIPSVRTLHSFVRLRVCLSFTLCLSNRPSALFVSSFAHSFVVHFSDFLLQRRTADDIVRPVQPSQYPHQFEVRLQRHVAVGEVDEVPPAAVAEQLGGALQVVAHS